MRRKLLFGLGLVSVLGSSAAAQFAADRAPLATPPAAGPFGGGGQPIGTPSVPAPVVPMPVAPTVPGGYVPPVGGFQPATPMPAVRPSGGFQPATPPVPVVKPEDIPLALGPNHPLVVKPEDGAYFICVKSYSRPTKPSSSDPGMTARELAEILATDIQHSHRCRVLLFELISEEKKAEAQARAAARQRAEQFAASLQAYKEKAALQGADFLGADTRVKYQTFNYRDQIAVLVGGFRTEDEAVKALGIIKKWPAPRDIRLMDGGAIATRTPDGKSTIEKTHFNPYPQAMVVQNPAIPKVAATGQGNIDPFLVKLNEERPYSLLRATKGWTLGVKIFSAPIQIQSLDAEPSVMQKLGISKGSDVLRAGAEQSEALAKALRGMKGPDGQMFESFVLHTRTGSFVTVGQFDSPNDPALIEMRRVLSNLTFTTTRDEQGRQVTGTGTKLFGDNLLPVPVPRP